MNDNLMTELLLMTVCVVSCINIVIQSSQIMSPGHRLYLTNFNDESWRYPGLFRLFALRSRRPMSCFSIYYIICEQLGKMAPMLPGPTIFSSPPGSHRSFGTLPVCKFQYYAIAFSPYPSPSSPDLCSKTYYITYSPYYVIVNIRMYYVKLKQFYLFFDISMSDQQYSVWLLKIVPWGNCKIF